ncbi:MAG: sigma-70 family RNA polymerase sigma factor [Oscillospiraceae bacterium]|nr:sigma-70 family RNA polymerase sigma factor [Oscillospiraceae bacterium]
MDEQALAEKIRRKDRSAMQNVLSEYGSTIKSVVYHYLGSLKQYREECIDDVLWKIWQNIGQFDAQRSTMKNWIAGICRHQAVDYRRKYLREMQQTYLDDIAEQRSDASAEEKISAFSAETEEILSVLSEKDRRLLISLYADGEEMDKLAKEMEMSRSGVYKRAERAKNKLRTLYPEMVEDSKKSPQIP